MLMKKNKRMVRKMKKYIKTFPLTEKEIDQMIEDITGMAEEAQERNEDFETVLGKSVHEFCDDLIYFSFCKWKCPNVLSHLPNHSFILLRQHNLPLLFQNFIY